MRRNIDGATPSVLVFQDYRYFASLKRSLQQMPTRVTDGLKEELVEADVCAPPARDSYSPGSQDDFDRLYRTCYQRILYTLLGIVRDHSAAEDCAQEAFVRAYRSWRDWKPDAPAEAWLHRIALNVAFSYRRWSRLREVGEVVRRLGSPKEESEGADPGLRSDLLHALRQLPPEQAAAIILRHHHGYTNREIAVALGMPESTVASRLAAGKKRLREELA